LSQGTDKKSAPGKGILPPRGDRLCIGLIRARETYREPLDIKIEEGLRERYAAGVFRFNDFRQNREAVTILVLKGAEALRPCTKSEAKDR
jgi:hypothetical protein